MRSRVSIAKYHGVAALSVVLVSGCTSILGIDGEYSSVPSGSSGGESAGAGGTAGKPTTANAGGAAGTTRPDAATGSGGDIGGGGSPSSMGGDTDASFAGHPSNGGAEAGGAAGEPASGGKAPTGGSAGMSSGGAAGAGGSGGTDAGMQPPIVCPLGTFNGTYSGTHHPVSGGTIFTAPIAGTISLRFVAAAKTTSTVTATLMPPAVPTTMGYITGTARGTFDCAKGTGSMSLPSPPATPAVATTYIPSLFTDAVEGSLDIKLDAGGDPGGTFSIRDPLFPTSATGSGTWSAR